MSVSTKEGSREPKVGDMNACATLAPKNTARMFCEVIHEDELGLITPDVWNTFGYAGNKIAQQGLLQQLYSQQRCAMMIARQSLIENIQYRYAVRVRPDLAFMKPMPSIQTLLAADKPNIVKFIDHSHCCCGNEDTFAIGHFSAMNLYFNRIVGFHKISLQFLTKKGWAAEDFLVEYLKSNFGIDLIPDRQIVGCIVKPLHRLGVSDT